MIKPIKIRIRKPQGSGIFHNSREDAALLGEVCNALIDKVNELADKVNQLESQK